MRNSMCSGVVIAGLWVAAALAEEPSFDCAQAESFAEELVCGDAQLAALDREMARLYALAAEGAHMTPERLDELKAFQRSWIKGRDDCWKAEDLAACVRDDYAMRITGLRQEYFDARQDDAAGVSIGPLSLACDGFGAGVGVTFINVDPPLAALHWRTTSIVLPIARSGSGARYAGDGYELWTKGDEASFTTPEGAFACRVEEIG